jgi:hypothetical protein
MRRSSSDVGDAPETFGSLIDEFIDSCLCWREACEDVRGAYQCWQQCNTARRGLAFASYRAALDREDQAARVYSMCADRVREARDGGHV